MLQQIKQDLAKFKDLSLSNKLYVLAAAVTIVIFSLLALSSIFLQKQLRQSQDLRQQAWVEDGMVDLSLQPSNGTSFDNHQSVALDVNLNTNSTNVSALQLQFRVYTTEANGGEVVSGNQVNFVAAEDQPDTQSPYYVRSLTRSSCNSEQHPECHQITMLISHFDPQQYLNTNADTTIGHIQFTPQVENDQAFYVNFTSGSYALIETDDDGDGQPEYRDSLNPHRDTYYYNITTDRQQCAVPPNFDIESLTCANTGTQEATAHLTWSEPNIDPASNPTYLVQLTKDNPDFSIGRDTEPPGQEDYIYSYTTTDQQMTFDQLDNGNWYARVRLNSNLDAAQHCRAPSSWSHTVNFEADCPGTPRCDVPTNLGIEYSACTADGLGDVEVAWDNVFAQDATLDYEVRLARDINFTQETQYILVEHPSYASRTLESGDWYMQVRVNQAELCQPRDQWSAPYLFTVDCDQPNQCQYIYNHDWGQCVNGWQEQTYQVVGENCPEPDWDNWHRPCMTQCQYECSDWTACGPDHIQTRHCEAVNEPCWDYVEDQEPQTYTEHRYCDLPATNDFMFGSYELCWYNASDGVSTYLAWSTEAYPDVDWIDVSPDQDFSNFAHKNVEDADGFGQYAVTNGQGFHWAGSGDDFYFEPETVYYARLYYRENEDDNFGHSRSTTFYMHRCEGDQWQDYQQCNETCQVNNDCAPGLYCYRNRCRLPENPDSDRCLAPDALQGCGEWCADDSECQSELTCWYNYCRNPHNIDIRITDETRISLALDRARETNCADWEPEESVRYRYVYYTPANYSPSTTYVTKGGQVVPADSAGTGSGATQTQGASQGKGSASGQLIQTSGSGDYQLVGCNQACNSNRNCEPNHRCYQGRCRLAINPESPSCGTKGMAGNTAGAGASDETDDIAGDGGATGATGDKVSPPPTLGPADDATDGADFADGGLGQDDTGPGADMADKPIEEQTAWDALQQYLEEQNISLPLAAAAGVAGLVLIISLLSLLGGGGKGGNKYQQQAANLSRLERDSGRNGGNGRVSGRPSPSSQTPTPHNSQSGQNTSQKTNGMAPPPSSMLNRMKQKGVRKPS